MTNKEWIEFQQEFNKAQASSPYWFALVDAAISYLIQDKIDETSAVSYGHHRLAKPTRWRPHLATVRQNERN